MRCRRDEPRSTYLLLSLATPRRILYPSCIRLRRAQQTAFQKREENGRQRIFSTRFLSEAAHQAIRIPHTLCAGRSRGRVRSVTTRRHCRCCPQRGCRHVDVWQWAYHTELVSRAEVVEDTDPCQRIRCGQNEEWCVRARSRRHDIGSLDERRRLRS